jgi:hypothetical protein
VQRHQRLQRRPREIESLDEIDADAPHRSQLARRLHTLRDQLDAEAPAQFGDAGDDLEAKGDPVATGDQRSVELHDVGRKVRQARQAGEAGAEIVKCELEILLAVFGENTREMAGLSDLLVLDHFEHQPVQRKIETARGQQRLAQAGGRLVHRIRHEIDVQVAAHAELCRHFDRGHTADLIKAIHALRIQAGQHLAGALAVGAAHERLLRIDLLRCQVDDRLKRHGQKRQLDRSPAGAAGF